MLKLFPTFLSRPGAQLPREYAVSLVLICPGCVEVEEVLEQLWGSVPGYSRVDPKGSFSGLPLLTALRGIQSDQ